ncbi:MAG TPA: sugar-transfer associated ATP-grasp domain-containing protein [Candidatus Tectomicrobia bacterium]|nr:sugar-transfer associated ATP-grasp domain-containing protein [Candidatus Tectomicrobia bacterium]
MRGPAFARLAKLARLVRLTLQRSREGHLPASVQFAEMAWLMLRRGIGPSYYHVAAFWRRDVPWREKNAHLGGREYARRVAALNPIEYRKLSQNKIAEKAILHLFAVPTPRFLGFFHPARGRCPSGAPLRSAADLARLIADARVNRLCFKRVEGWGGAGFRAVDVREDHGALALTPVLGSRASTVDEYVEDLVRGGDGDGWILEEYLHQHERLRAFNPTSVNTMRLWVVRRGDAAPVTLGGYLRIGRAGSLVDNRSSGGIIAPIDAATGTLRAATSGYAERPEYRAHPDHGAPIEGQSLPFWGDACALAASTLSLFPHLGFAGFDIAVSATGPVVIELNPIPDVQGAAGIPLREVLRP